MSETTTPPLPKEAFLTINLDETDRKFLSGALGMLSQRSPSGSEAAAAFGLLAVKVRSGKDIFTKGESDLMHHVISATLKAGEGVKERTQDLEARVRASAITTAYETIKGKIENGKPTE